MRTILFILCICVSIKFIHNSQCTPRSDLAGYCGCCPLIGGNCIYYETIDGIAVSWHLCVPDHLKETFTLEQCKPNLIVDKNLTRICRTNNGTFRLFPQCTTKDLCSLPIAPITVTRRNYTADCDGPIAVKGTCKKSLKRFSYDSKQRECVPFIYSGCGGSKNRFILQERCEKLCKKLT